MNNDIMKDMVARDEKIEYMMKRIQEKMIKYLPDDLSQEEKERIAKENVRDLSRRIYKIDEESNNKEKD